MHLSRGGACLPPWRCDRDGDSEDGIDDNVNDGDTDTDAAGGGGSGHADDGPVLHLVQQVPGGEVGEPSGAGRDGCGDHVQRWKVRWKSS